MTHRPVPGPRRPIGVAWPYAVPYVSAVVLVLGVIATFTLDPGWAWALGTFVLLVIGLVLWMVYVPIDDPAAPPRR